MSVRTIAVAELHAEMRAQGVSTHEDIAFVCPACGTVQSMRDFIAAGYNPVDAERKIGFSCIGRVTGQGDAGIVAKNKGQPWDKGCNWTLGGLLQIHRLTVITPDGTSHPSFELASPPQAQAHAEKHKQK